jgi:hypothetical protein
MQELIINAPSGVIDNRAAGMKDCLKVRFFRTISG